MRKGISFAVLLLFLLSVRLSSQEQRSAAVISIDAAHPGAAISPSMFGIFFEDINFGADGGLYPELVKNRSFEFNDPLTGWHEIMMVNAKGIEKPKGELDIRTEDAAQPDQSALSASARVRAGIRILERRLSRYRGRRRG